MWRSGHECLNIYGTADDEVAFGIDGSDCMGNEEVVRFTKTNRIMRMRIDSVVDIVFPPTSRLGIHTETIKFFDH